MLCEHTLTLMNLMLKAVYFFYTFMLKIFVDAVYKSIWNKYSFMMSIFKYEHLTSGVCRESEGPAHVEVDIRETAN